MSMDDPSINVRVPDGRPSTKDDRCAPLRIGVKSGSRRRSARARSIAASAAYLASCAARKFAAIPVSDDDSRMSAPPSVNNSVVDMSAITRARPRSASSRLMVLLIGRGSSYVAPHRSGSPGLVQECGHLLTYQLARTVGRPDLGVRPLLIRPAT